MKILKLTHTYYPSIGGGIRYKKAIVDYFRRKGQVVDVLAISINGKFSTEGNTSGSIIRVPALFDVAKVPISPLYIYFFTKMVKNYDILHFNYPSPMCEIALLLNSRRVSNIKTVVMYHADIVKTKTLSRLYNRVITKSFLKLMDSIVVSSPNIVKTSPHLQPFRQKIHVIPFGIDPNDFVRKNKNNREQDSAKKPLILFVGRLSRYKGVDLLIRAMKGVFGRLEIVGDGPLRNELFELARNAGLAERIIFRGFISEEKLIDLYHEADILVLPSTDEGEAFGYVLIEAMANRTAVISTELGTGTSYVNEHGKTGLVVPPNNSEALADGIHKLINNKAKLEKMKESAYQRVKSRFTIDRMLKDTETLLRSLWRVI